MTRRAFPRLLAAALAFALGCAQANGVEALRDFAREVKSAQARFTQTVTSPDGKKTKTSSGRFEFARPDRFRFVYLKPFEQTIVGDGSKIWIHDPDLNQVSSRRVTEALGATPAALLAGAAIERDFELAALPDAEGLEWVRATPKAPDSSFQAVRVGFKGKTLSAIDITDTFGQRSLLRFSEFTPNVAFGADAFRFVVPKGADVIEQ